MTKRAQSDPALEQVRVLTAALEVPRPWHLGTFVEHVSASLGKSITLHPHQALTSSGFPCGIVIECQDRIVVAYDATSSGYHANHIVLHEIAHLLLDHAGFVSPVAQRRTIRTLFPGMDAETALRVLARTDYDDIVESQAELFASLVMSEADASLSCSALGRAIFRR